jgi:Xaa-Pro aminopeptidase
MTRFNKQFFAGNRERLMQALPDSLIVMTANASLQQSADLAFPFRQDSSFWYLTGIAEPDLLLVIDTKKASATILLPEQNDYQIEWDGVIETTSYQQTSGVTSFESQTSLKKIIKEAKKAGLSICSLQPSANRVEPYGFYANPARRLLFDLLKECGVGEPKDIRVELARLRQVKQNPELEAIKTAIQATATSLEATKERLETFTTEKDIERAISAGFFAAGADGHAYEPIVASGKNASIIHYNKNNQPLKNKELVLLDVGAQVDGYAADISRNWAVGKPTNRQQEIWSAVIELQDEAFSLLKPGVLLRGYQETMEARAAKMLERLGKSPRQFPHGFSHFLGLDVHDTGDYAAPLVPGSVLTVEPGFYFPDEGIGVRVEDNILITEKGYTNLSVKIPKLL